MGKDYMKSGEIREGNSLHFDGVGYYTKPEVDHLKVNKWIRKQGFVWEVAPGTTDKPNPFNGIWVDQHGDRDPIQQDEAARMYQARPGLLQRLLRHR